MSDEYCVIKRMSDESFAMKSDYADMIKIIYHFTKLMPSPVLASASRKKGKYMGLSALVNGEQELKSMKTFYKRGDKIIRTITLIFKDFASPEFNDWLNDYSPESLIHKDVNFEKGYTLVSLMLRENNDLFLDQMMEEYCECKGESASELITTSCGVKTVSDSVDIDAIISEVKKIISG